MRVACIAEGLDPDLGYLHVDERLRSGAVFDFLEPLRARVDSLSFEWAQKRGLRPWMFIELREARWEVAQQRLPATQASF
jgi:CRISPR/Cas system-associated endonuclease Cas1